MGESPMKKLTIAGMALVGGIMIAVPAIAWSAADDRPQAEHDGPARGMAGMGAGMPGGTGMMGGADDDGDGMMRRHHGGMRHMMRRMAQMSPQQRCEDRIARRAAYVAYMVTKLKLTAEQQPLWDKVSTGLHAARDKELQFCASIKPPEQRKQATVLDRTERLEQYLSMRLQNVQQVRPAMTQLYQALTPEQKAVIDRPFSRG
jgi:periplasmic protein CpxP/Spy